MLCALLRSSVARAQYSDSTHYLLGANVSGNINRTNDGTNYLLDNGLKAGIRKSKLELNEQMRWLYGSNATKLVNNDFSSLLDLNVFPSGSARINYWGLTNFTSSYSLKIDYQIQAGAGIAYRIVDKPGLKLKVSNGLLYENSRVVPTASFSETYGTLRNSLRLQLKANWGERLSFESTGFWQPSLHIAGDFIINAQGVLSFRIGKWLSLNSRLQYMQVSRTHKQNLLFTYGIRIERYF